ncbi:MAG: protein kinase domain-containing protein [Solirubrobacterales bacterium]
MRSLEPGTVFAGHRIEGIAGRGGMGVVYRATHLALDQVVALKVITPDLVGDDRFRARFQSESRIAASIRHPNVVSIHHAGEEEGLLFVTMDFVEGTDLRGLLDRDGWLEPAEAASILGQVAAALDAAHSRGLIHRDIKPANVLIEAREEGNHAGDHRRGSAVHAFLTDFGLARAIDAETGLTATGAFIGTLDYAAPEQIEGKRLDARTDVYALGCLLHEMLSGSTPFAKQTEKVAKMFAHLSEPPPDLGELRPELPPELAAAVARSMAKDPEERFQSAGDLWRAVTAAIEKRAAPEQGTVATGEAAPPESEIATEQVVAPLAVTEPSQPATATAPGRATETAPEPKPEPAPTAPLPRRDVAARRRRVALGGAALAVVAVITGIVLLSGNGEDSPTVPDSTLSSGGGEQGQGGDEGQGGGEQFPGRAKLAGNPIAVGGFPVGVAVGFDHLWVASRLGGTLTEIDPQSKDVVRTVPGLAAPEGVSAGPASIYVALSDSGEVLRVDGQSGRESRIAVGTNPRAIAHGGRGIYVTNAGDGTVTPIAIEPDSETPLEPIPVGVEPHGIAIGEGSVWVTNRGSASVSRLDEESGELIDDAIPVGANPKGIAVADGIVWVANTDDGTVTPIDAASGKPGGAFDVGVEPRGVVAGFDSIWVAIGGGSVARIDPVKGEMVQQIPVEGSPEEVAAGEKFIYASTGEGESVARIKP